MNDGKAPQMRVKMTSRKTGIQVERDVSMELHHRDIP
jgi:hypothetical protein